MIEVRQLRCFVAVVEELHFAKAADRLDVAQSALSSQIQRLEQELGVTLLNRNKRRPVTLTDAGHLFYAEAVATLRHLERADQIGRLAARGLAGVVRIAFVASGVSSGVLSKILRQFRPGHDNVRIEVVAMDTPRQYEALDSGEIDIGIVRPRRQYAPGLAATVVHRERLLLAMSQDHPFANKRQISAADLRDQPFIAPQFKEEEGFGEQLSELGKAGGFSVQLEHRVHDFISAMSLASAGYGVAVVPESMRNLSLPGICYRPFVDFECVVDLVLARRKRDLSPAVRAFVNEALKLSDFN